MQHQLFFFQIPTKLLRAGFHKRMVATMSSVINGNVLTIDFVGHDTLLQVAVINWMEVYNLAKAHAQKTLDDGTNKAVSTEDEAPVSSYVSAITTGNKLVNNLFCGD